MLLSKNIFVEPFFLLQNKKAIGQIEKRILILVSFAMNQTRNNSPIIRFISEN